MPGDVLVIQGLDLSPSSSSMRFPMDSYGDLYATDLDGFGELGDMAGLGGLVPSGADIKNAAIAGFGLAIGLGVMMSVERFLKRQFSLSDKVLPFAHVIGGLAIGKLVATWINPMLGAAITAAGATIGVIRFSSAYLGYKMSNFAGLSESAFDGFGEDMDGLGDSYLDGLDGLDGLDQITVDNMGAVVPEMA